MNLTSVEQRTTYTVLGKEYRVPTFVNRPNEHADGVGWRFQPPPMLPLDRRREARLRKMIYYYVSREDLDYSGRMQKTVADICAFAFSRTVDYWFKKNGYAEPYVGTTRIELRQTHRDVIAAFEVLNNPTSLCSNCKKTLRDHSNIGKCLYEPTTFLHLDNDNPYSRSNHVGVDYFPKIEQMTQRFEAEFPAFCAEVYPGKLLWSFDNLRHNSYRSKVAEERETISRIRGAQRDWVRPQEVEFSSDLDFQALLRDAGDYTRYVHYSHVHRMYVTPTLRAFAKAILKAEPGRLKEAVEDSRMPIYPEQYDANGEPRGAWPENPAKQFSIDPLAYTTITATSYEPPEDPTASYVLPDDLPF